MYLLVVLERLLKTQSISERSIALPVQQRSSLSLLNRSLAKVDRVVLCCRQRYLEKCDCTILVDQVWEAFLT
jgi:hypothetical protein